ncbi:MAG TPA: glycosyltransferase, partial [Candidatus Dormibacteraeota bacterium]|nr:glycosyltransferase [Candidatus Dormibacteraeota bacterium]
MPPDISVVVPTYHRPAMLGRAVRSALAQRLGTGELEVVVALSDATAEADREAAAALAREDARVVVAVAPRLGPPAARNARLAAASGARIALLD